MEMYEELVKRLRNIANSDGNIKSNYIGLTMLQAADAIEELSMKLHGDEAADVVEVVRCRDCKHLYVRSGALGVYECELYGGYPSGEYFCAYGERKDGGQEDV